MNRIESLCARRVTARREQTPRSEIPITCSSACHFYVAPLHYEPNYSYPLLIWLHGPHNNEVQIRQIMPLVSLRNYVGAAPRATAQSEQDDGSRIRFCWRQDERSVELAEDRLWDCLEGARLRFNIAADRVFLAGLECGGTMALRLALRSPERFAGALSFGGPFPMDRAPLARLSAARRLPLFFVTTAESSLYPQTQVCQNLRLFHSAGLSVTIQQYPGEDGLTDRMLADMDRWIMERITQERASVSAGVWERRPANRRP